MSHGSKHIGLKSGLLTVQTVSHERRHSDKYPKMYAHCLCDCGKQHECALGDVVNGGTKSCGCNRGAAIGNSHKHAPGSAARRKTYASYKHSAARRAISFSLSFETFTEITSNDCTYCGSAPSNIAVSCSKKGVYNGEFVFNGIDRVDNAIGYELGNVVACCKFCNMAKRDLTVAQFLSKARQVVAHNLGEAGVSEAVPNRVPD